MLAHLGVADEHATCNFADATCNEGGHVLLQKAFRSEGKTHVAQTQAFRSEGKTRVAQTQAEIASQPEAEAAAAPCTCVMSDPSWTPSVRTVPRCVFIDLGAADGNSFQTFLSNGFGDLAKCPGGQWSAVLVEANPLFNTKLAAVAAQHPGQINMMSATAAYMCEATTSFFLDTKNTDKNFWGSSMSNDHPDVQGGKEKVTVPTMNLNKILLELTIPGDWVTVKMDIEGSEYDVLPCTAQAPAASLIDRLYMEQHTWLPRTGLAGTTPAQMDDAKNTLLSRGVEIPEYFSDTL